MQKGGERNKTTTLHWKKKEAIVLQPLAMFSNAR